MARITLTGGTDNMTQSPFTVRNIRFGVPLGQSPILEDSLWLGLSDSYCKMSMAQTAEKLGAEMKVTKEEVDQFSLRSQQLWKAGIYLFYNNNKIINKFIAIQKYKYTCVRVLLTSN